MRVRKEVIRPGHYFYRDKLGAEKILNATPDLIKYWHDSGNAMRSAGLPIPVPLEHDPTAHPLTPADKLLNNTGEVENFEIADLTEKGADGKDVLVKNVLFSNTDIKDEKVQGKIKDDTIRWTSPYFTSFTDHTGKRWDGVIGHLALTSRPVLARQQPFQANLSLTPSSEVSSLEGTCLSRAGLVSESQPGTFRPLYPVAFSQWTGASLAFEDVKEEKTEKKEGGKETETVEKTEKEGGDGGGKEMPFGKGKDKGKNGMGHKFDPMTGQPIKESLVDPAGDISAWCVVADMLSMLLNVDVAEDVNEENGLEKVYEVLRQAMRDKMAAGAGVGTDTVATDTNAPPPNRPAPKAPTNPIIQEQQPMYMSLEQANAIADPALKSMALSLVKMQEEKTAQEKQTAALRQKLFNDAKTSRDRRIGAICKIMPDTDRQALQALADGAQFSLGDDGVVKDPIEPWLKQLERQQQLLPALLRVHGTELSVVDQPEETHGGIPESRIKQVREEYHRAAGVAS